MNVERLVPGHHCCVSVLPLWPQEPEQHGDKILWRSLGPEGMQKSRQLQV